MVRWPLVSNTLKANKSDQQSEQRFPFDSKGQKGRERGMRGGEEGKKGEKRERGGGKALQREKCKVKEKSMMLRKTNRNTDESLSQKFW